MQLFEEIYEMYSRKVFLFLLTKTNNEELVQIFLINSTI